MNDAPSVSTIAPQITTEDQPLAVPFTVSDLESAAGSLTVQATSSNTALVNAAGIGLGGSGGSRLVTLAPRPNEAGSTTITLSVSDGAATTERSFTLTVTAANDPPAFVSLVPLVSTTRDVPATFAVTVSDPDSAGSGLTLALGSANTTLLPAGGIAVAPTASTSSTRTFQVTLTPTAGQTGASTLTLQAERWRRVDGSIGGIQRRSRSDGAGRADSRRRHGVGTERRD